MNSKESQEMKEHKSEQETSIERKWKFSRILKVG